MADDEIYNYINDYMDGIISRTSFWDIGKVYMRLIIELGGMSVTRFIDVYNSYIAECIDDYTIGFYFSNPQCIYESYKSGTMLD